MKKILYLLTALSFSFIACNKVLDVSPVDSVSAEDAIKDKVGVERALTGTYNALQAVGLYSRNAIIVGDLAADNLTWTGTMLEYGQIENKPIPAENPTIEGMWAASYDGINRANNILVKLPAISDLTQQESDNFEGEALFIRALLHYYLSGYFGGVPIRTQPTLDLSNIDIARSTLTQVYDQVITDLTTAKTKLSGTKVVGRANTFSASALLAKVYLAKYHLTGEKQMADLAVAEAGRVITEGGYSIDPLFGNLFDPAVPSAESVFEIVYDVQNYNRLAQYFYSRDLSGRYEVAPTANLIQSFDTSDLRMDFSFTYDAKNQPYGIKYNDISGGADRVNVFRLAEMYLIRAEALAYSGGDITSIQADINVIRNRAGLENTEATDIPGLKIAVMNECRHEFAFEGHRWSDLVRTKTAAAVLGIDEKYTLFPIPLAEMQTNSLMKQNDGY
jgi:starch-binding outer membrane protein, SusD/RagB family